MSIKANAGNFGTVGNPRGTLSSIICIDRIPFDQNEYVCKLMQGVYIHIYIYIYIYIYISMNHLSQSMMYGGSQILYLTNTKMEVTATLLLKTFMLNE